MRAARVTGRMCDQHGHKGNCVEAEHENHRRDVDYLLECLLMMGVINEKRELQEFFGVDNPELTNS